MSQMLTYNLFKGGILMKPFIEGIKNLHKTLELEIGCFSPEEIMVVLCRVCPVVAKFNIYIDIGTPGTGKSSTLSFLINDTDLSNSPKTNKIKFKNAPWAKNLNGEDAIFSLFK